MKSIVFLILLNIISAINDKIQDEESARQFMLFSNNISSILSYNSSVANFNFETDISNETQAISFELDEEIDQFDKFISLRARSFDFEHFTDRKLKKWFQLKSGLNSFSLKTEEHKNMTGIYGSATVCALDRCGLELEPDLTDMFAYSRDYNELEKVWNIWRDSTGPPIRPLYKEYIRLANREAQRVGYISMDEWLISEWQTQHFKQQMEDLWRAVEPIYKILHTFVKMKLKQKYGKRMPSDGTIPAHLLGNMWAQQWHRIFDIIAPFPERPTMDVTDNMRKENYTIHRMFRIAEKFYVELGLYPMTEEFWNNSMLVKPKKRTVLCHASAFVFTKTDYRIKMCTELTMADLLTVHHEMGHIEYYMAYRNQPDQFKGGANPAIGDTIALSVSTPAHLNKIGLFTDLKDDFETTINSQMIKALEKIAFLPFGYIIDLWRWETYSGQTPYNQWNRRWWQLRLQYQGISPPNKRTELDFDPGAKYHVVAAITYISLCSIAQPNVPFHKCDIDQNKVAGAKLLYVLKLGSSKPWPEAMELLTGTKHISVGPLIEYFDPLLNYMKYEIKNEKIGWNSNVNHYFETMETNP